MELFAVTYMFFRNCIAVLFGVIIPCLAYPQDLPSVQQQDSVYVTQKIQGIKSNMEDPVFEEDSFFEIYMEFMSEKKKNVKCSFLTLSNLAKIASGGDNSEVFECLNSLLVYREKNIQIKKKYFNRLTNEINGLVAFHFLQAEEMLNVIEGFEEYKIGSVRWDDGNEGNRARLRELKSMFDFERSQVSGEDMSCFESCFTEIFCMNPGQAVKTGKDLIAPGNREERLNHKYFNHIVSTSGAFSATTFFARKEQGSVTCKLEILPGFTSPKS